MRVLFAGGGSGGHLYPGLAIARALVTAEPRAEPFFIGARRGVERDVLPTTEFPFLLLDLHPLYRARPWRNWHTVAGLGSAWNAVGGVLRTEHPVLAVGTGGYASGATLARAAAAHVPIVLQEQNSYPGATTRLLSRWAREVYLGYGEAAALLRTRPDAWIGETGNPIAPPPTPRPDRAQMRVQWGFPASGGLVVLIVGGSQGSRALNDIVAAFVRRGVPNDTYLLWATGRGLHDQYAALESDRVRVVPYLAPIANAYAAADVAITRAGASTIGDLCAWALPAILVPLPTAAADHQSANAKVLDAAGAAVCVPQSAFTADRMAAELARLGGDPALRASIAGAAAARARPHAADVIAGRIARLIAGRD